jgi:hypothetical protein
MRSEIRLISGESKQWVKLTERISLHVDFDEFTVWEFMEWVNA